MSASGPLLESAPDFLARPAERILGRAVSQPRMTGFKQPNQHHLGYGLVRFDESSDFLQERVRVLLRGFHQWLTIVLAEVLSEEVEPLADMPDAGLVGQESAGNLLVRVRGDGVARPPLPRSLR